MPASAYDMQRLAETCWTHLGHEEDVLTETLQLVEQTRHDAAKTRRRRSVGDRCTVGTESTVP